MGRNAQRRRAKRDAARLRAGVGRPPRIQTPVPRYLDLIDYLITRRFCRSRREARTMLLAGRVNVNGETWAYPHVPKADIETDQFGRLKIMVEGMIDPRPVDEGLVLRSNPTPNQGNA